jgi:hypothetical protein
MCKSLHVALHIATPSRAKEPVLANVSEWAQKRAQ